MALLCRHSSTLHPLKTSSSIEQRRESDGGCCESDPHSFGGQRQAAVLILLCGRQFRTLTRLCDARHAGRCQSKQPKVRMVSFMHAHSTTTSLGQPQDRGEEVMVGTIIDERASSVGTCMACGACIEYFAGTPITPMRLLSLDVDTTHTLSARQVLVRLLI